MITPTEETIVVPVRSLDLGDVARAAWLGAFDKRNFMAVFHAYFDASGTKRNSVLTVAGFVARVGKWQRFAAEWESILAAHGVGFFHMTDFVSSQGEFRTWKGDSHRRRIFISQLVECARKHTNKGIAASVVLDDYDAVNSIYPFRESAGTPFAICARACVGTVVRWALKKGVSMSELLFVIEDGDDDKGDFLERTRKDKFSVVTMQKSSTPAFQAADLVGWKVRTAVDQTVSAEDPDDILSVVRSLSTISSAVAKNGVFDRDALTRLCENGKLSRRDSIRL